MNEHATKTKRSRAAPALPAIALLAGVSACNVVSGVDEINFSGTGGSAPIVCAGDFCTYGMGGYAFAYSDSQQHGTSTAVLAMDGSLCISGQVAVGSVDNWGCGLGIRLNQARGGGASSPPMSYTLTGSGVTVNVTGFPACLPDPPLVYLDQYDTQTQMDPGYCALLTPGKEIPWSAFQTQCWAGMGPSLTGAPSSVWLKIQLQTGPTACPFTNFCITEIEI